MLNNIPIKLAEPVKFYSLLLIAWSSELKLLFVLATIFDGLETTAFLLEMLANRIRSTTCIGHSFVHRGLWFTGRVSWL